MVKKKIIIVSHSMEIGGAEKSLLGLLEALDLNSCEVDLFLLRHEGELLKYIPSGINLLPEVTEYTTLARPMKTVLKEGHILLVAGRLYAKGRAALFKRINKSAESAVELEYSHKYTFRLMPKINPNKEYDLAISFLTPHYIVANKVKTKKSIAWIHTDYSKIGIDTKSEEAMWSQYDFVASISQDVTKSFLAVFPALKNKIILVENILPQNLIKIQANELDADAYFRDKSIKLLSIGRYCNAKNFDSIPEICKVILDSGIDVHWYIIGYGADENLIRSRIKTFHVEKNVLMIGKKENPYPYIRECDLYVQPSRYEGKCVTVREAQLLGRPVVIANYKTARSQLEDGVDGIIVPQDSQQCAQAIIAILQNQEKRNSLANNCKTRDYANTKEVDKLYQLMC